MVMRQDGDGANNPWSIPSTVLTGGLSAILGYLREARGTRLIPSTIRNIMLLVNSMAGKTSFAQFLVAGKATLSLWWLARPL